MFKTIVVIGSRKYRNRAMMEQKLDSDIKYHYLSEETIIMSGKCPMEDSVDNWAIEWAEKEGYYPLEVPPLGNDTPYYFERNRIMAYYADQIIAFIPRNQFRSGAWNCIAEFRKFKNAINYIVYDENGEIWDRKWKK